MCGNIQAEPKSKYLIAPFPYFGPRGWPCVSAARRQVLQLHVWSIFSLEGWWYYRHEDTCSTQPSPQLPCGRALMEQSETEKWEKEHPNTSEHLSGQRRSALSNASAEAMSADICGLITSIPFHSFLEVTHIHLSRTKVEEWINTTSQTKSFLVNVLELSVLNTNIPWQRGEGGGDRITQTYKIVPWNFRLNLQVQRFTLYDAVSRVYIF